MLGYNKGKSTKIVGNGKEVMPRKLLPL